MTIGTNSRPQNSGIGELSNGSAKLPLSSSLTGISNGNPLVALDSGTSPGYTEVHNFSLGVIEELYLWCANAGSVAVELTMSFGDSTFAGNNNIVVSVSGKTGMNLVYPGVPHLGDITETQKLYVRSSSSSLLTVNGFIIRSYPFSGKNSVSYGYFNSESGD